MVRMLRQMFLQCLLGASFALSAGALVFDDGGDHLIDYDTTGAQLQIYNAGQSPGGAPTHVELAEGGDAFATFTYYSSTFLMTGGVLDGLFTQGSAEAEVEGGTLNNTVNANETSTIHIRGGLLEDGINVDAYEDSLIVIEGSGFELQTGPDEWTSLGEGPLPGVTGVVRGTLSSGDAFRADYHHQDSYFLNPTGTIELAAPEPGAASLGAAAVAALMGLARRRSAPRA